MNSNFPNLKEKAKLAIKEKNIAKISSVLELMFELAAIDFLTKSFTRWKIQFLLSNAIKQAFSMENNFSILMIDIDKFKKINDKYGHSIGDDVLRKVSNIIKNNIRPTDLFGRWGGEEFLIILPGADLDNSKIIGERLRKAMELGKLGVTISIGAAQYKGSDNLNSIINRADKLLYCAKKSGGNKCH